MRNACNSFLKMTVQLSWPLVVLLSIPLGPIFLGAASLDWSTSWLPQWLELPGTVLPSLTHWIPVLISLAPSLLTPNGTCSDGKKGMAAPMYPVVELPVMTANSDVCFEVVRKRKRRTASALINNV